MPVIYDRPTTNQAAVMPSPVLFLTILIGYCSGKDTVINGIIGADEIRAYSFTGVLSVSAVDGR